MTDKTGKEASHRTLTSLQSTGRIGRSTLKQGLMSWFSYAGIEFNAIDADPEHRTLSSWYPDLTDKKPYHDENDLLPILNAVGEAGVQLRSSRLHWYAAIPARCGRNSSNQTIRVLRSIFSSVMIRSLR